MEERREINDSPEHLEKDNPIPKAWMILFVGLILWGLYYIWFYTPQISGWSYYKRLEAELTKEKQILKEEKPLHENPYEQNEKAIAEGKVIYATYCSMCHGDNLKGGVGPDLTGRLKYGETDDKKFESIAKGRGGGMPPFLDQLGRDRIWKVLAYVDSVREYGRPY